MDIDRLASFVRVAEAGSLSAAGAALGVPQPTLTRHIAELEASLGARLLHRTGRGVVPTEAGRLALERARAMLAEAERMRAEVTAEQRSPSGPVSLAMLASVAEYLVPPLFARVRAEFPGIRVRVREGFSTQVEAWLAAGEVDLGIFNTTHRQGAGAGADRLGSSRLVRAGTAGAALAPTEPLRSLEGRALILPAAGNNIRRAVEEACARLGFGLRVIFELDSVRSIRDLAAAGVGWTVLPEHAVRDQVAAGRLRAALLRDPVLRQQIVLAPTRRRPSSPAVLAVLRLAREVSRGAARLAD